jgi:lipopolysaccharide transport system permease protein
MRVQEKMLSALIDEQGAGRTRLAFLDVFDGVALWPLWGKLGWNDILQRYRRSLLGPLWLTLSMAIMVVALGVVYAQIFKIGLRDFMPFLCVGLLVWGFISSSVTEAGTLFTGAESYIKQVRLPYSVYVFRFMWSKIIIFAHNFLIYFGVLAYFEIWPGSAALYALPGFLLVAVNCAFASLYLGMVSARYRDIPQIVGSAIQIVFFVTPIMWKPELVGADSYLVLFNPFYHMCEIVRAPLLGQIPSYQNYVAISLISAFNLALAALVFVRFRARISYWI